MTSIANLNPVWEAAYTRQFFDFSDDPSKAFNAGDDDRVYSPP